MDTYKGIWQKEKWLDSQEVCLLLGISKRALQYYKDQKLLPFSCIHRKNYSQLENLKQQMDFILKNFRPVFDGEVFLSGKEVCELLHITKRTLQQYRDDGLFPYIQIGGKILFKQSDILKVLEANYHK